MGSEETEPICERCGNLMDYCKCACPYCGETAGCECSIGIDKATGG
jgi:hypothetical protein